MKVDPNTLNIDDPVKIVSHIFDHVGSPVIWEGVVCKMSWTFPEQPEDLRISCKRWLKDKPEVIGAWLFSENDFFLLS